MIKVIARKGVKVPVEGHPERYITDEQAEAVPHSTWWQRRLDDGDLLLFSEPEAETEATDVALVKPVEKATDKTAKANK